jgi:predicted Fe-Mo cluster-binding NifX family protein
MNSSLVLAIPSNNPGGLEAEISEHFGHCDLFTLIKIQEGKVASVETVSNVEHAEGGCMAPVQLLKNQGVQAIVVGGIGARPLQAFSEVSIDVYYGDRGALNNVEAAANGMIDGNFPVMRSDQACGGHSNCHS